MIEDKHRHNKLPSSNADFSLGACSGDEQGHNNFPGLIFEREGLQSQQNFTTDQLTNKLLCLQY